MKREREHARTTDSKTETAKELSVRTIERDRETKKETRNRHRRGRGGGVSDHNKTAFCDQKRIFMKTKKADQKQCENGV